MTRPTRFIIRREGERISRDEWIACIDASTLLQAAPSVAAIHPFTKEPIQLRAANCAAYMDVTAGRCTFELRNGSLKVKAPGEEVIEQITIIARALHAIVLPESTDMKGAKVIAADEKQNDASDFRAVLGDKLTGTYDDKLVSLHVYSLGELSLPSGKIVAADAFILDGEPFTRSVTPGSYPVTVAVADLGEDQRIAFAQIRFSNEHVARWEMALRPGQNAERLKTNELFGYAVDSGTGCFTDPGVQEILRLKDARVLIDAAMDEMETVYQHTRSWVRIDTPVGGVVMFSSGFGDGIYASYFGLDASGEVVALVTDFDVVDWDARPRGHGAMK